MPFTLIGSLIAAGVTFYGILAQKQENERLNNEARSQYENELAISEKRFEEKQDLSRQKLGLQRSQFGFKRQQALLKRQERQEERGYQRLRDFGAKMQDLVNNSVGLREHYANIWKR